jgi:3-oxoacyl-[acyl-carrier-protein] synthase III
LAAGIQGVQNLQYQRQAAEAEAFKISSKAHDDAFLKANPDFADTRKAKQLQDGTLAMLKKTGLSDADISALWNNQASLSLRDHRAQTILAKAARWDMLQAGLKPVRAAPKPTISPGARNDGPARGTFEEL